MKTKTINARALLACYRRDARTPSVGLTLILRSCDKCYDSVIKSTLLCQRHTTRHDHYRGSIPQKEKQKKIFISVHRWLNSVCSLFLRPFGSKRPKVERSCFLQCLRKQNAPRQNPNAFGFCSRFSLFFLDEKESLKGITVFGGRLSGCLHTSRLATNGVNTLTRVSFSTRGF